MKWILLLLINSLFNNEISSIESKSFVFAKTGSAKVISGNASYTEIVLFIGKSYRREKLYNEIDEINYYKYYHQGAVFNVTGSQVDDFQITSPNYYVGERGKMIRVGDLLSTLASKYPASYKKRENDGMIIYFSGMDKGTRWFSDSYLLIDYHPKTLKITKISLMGPCC